LLIAGFITILVEKSMGFNLFIGSLLIVATIIIHAGVTRLVLFLAMQRIKRGKEYKEIRVIRLSFYVLIVFFASILEALVWAISYYNLGATTSMEQSLYFSIVTFTTLGYGDITLSESYRLLASLQAANGIIIFGWSTAIIMAVVQKLYLKR